MNIFTKRNAVVGYLALRALRRARRNAAVGYLAVQGVEHTRARRRGNRALRISLYVALGVVSLGILAAVAARVAKRQRAEPVPLEETVTEAPSVDEAAELPAEEGATPVATAEPLPVT